jgi:hypothetical protein
MTSWFDDCVRAEMTMEITLGPELESAVSEWAQRQGIAPETLILKVLRERFLPSRATLVPQDEWERRLLSAASDCGVSLPDSALSRDELYD